MDSDIKDCNDVAFPNVHIHEIEDLGWIVNSSNKSKYICNIQQDLKGYDCVFYINSNLVFTSVIYASEIIPQASHNYLTALSFDYYLGIDKYNYPYDRNPECHAFISFGEGCRYYQGGFYGGRTAEMLELSEWCQKAIDEDLDRKVIARYHDESYLNRYLLDKSPKVLNDEYAMQDIWSYQGHFKAVIRNKRQVLGDVLDVIRDNYTNEELFFLLDDRLCFKPGAIVNLYGGLGNQMFGYAFYKYIEKLDGGQHHWWINATTYQKYEIHNGYELSSVFNQIRSDILLTDKLHKHIQQVSEKNKENIKELLMSSVQTFGITNKPLVFYSGCWQCYQYVEACADELRQLFKFNENCLNESSILLLPQIKNACSVSVHFRRGDYNKGNNEWLYDGICTVEYYQNAMLKIESLLSEVPLYIFFSDDPVWVQEHFNLNNAILVDWNQDKDSWQDMFLMASCRHHILANSSFSWWAAWLGQSENTKIIVPNTWCNVADTPDLLPSNWIKIPVLPDRTLLHRLFNKLLLESSFLDALGLQRGKMGAVLFFFHYARYMSSSVYENYAEELFDEVYDEVNKGLSYSFVDGLCGIGWAVEYLVKNEFIAGNTDDALLEIDRQLMLYDPMRMSDYSFAHGLDGIVCYVMSRLLSCRGDSTPLPFDKRYRDCLYVVCKNISVLQSPNYLDAYIDYMEKGCCCYSFDDVLKKMFSLSEEVFGMNGMTWQTGVKMTNRKYCKNDCQF